MSERLLIEARNRVVALEGERIVAIAGVFDRVLRFPDAEVRPGLINAHDHLHRNHYGRLGNPPYEDAGQWAADIRVSHAERIAAGKAVPRREMLLRGAWKNLFAGVTTVVHHDPWERDFERGFPLRVVPIDSANSLDIAPGVEGIDPTRPWCLHLAEGRNDRAADEVRRLDRLGLLGPNLIAVHGNGMDSDAIARFRASGAALVWCPTSNLFLFGRTARSELLAEGTDVLLGSDSLLTGDGNLLDELRAARATGLVSDCRLEDAVGGVAARRLGLPAPGLEPGDRADLVVLAKPLLEANAEDVRLVVCAGVPRVAAPELATSLPNGVRMTVAGVTRWVGVGSSIPARDWAKSGGAMNRNEAQTALSA